MKRVLLRPALVVVAALGLAALATPPAAAQDLNPRRGFSVKLVEPKASDILFGEVLIKAQVTTRREEDIQRVDFFLDDQLLLADPEPPYQVVHNFGRKSKSHVIRAVARHREGATVSDFVITKAVDLQFVVNVQRVVLEVSVRDDKRRWVTGLEARDFVVVEEGRPQKIQSVTLDRRPLLVGVVIDTSGSMRERMEDAQSAACAFMQALEDKDRGFVIDFDEQVTLVEEITSDRERLCRAIRSTTAVGGTALHDAIHAAYRVVREVPSERRALVVLSDGEDNESRTTFDELAAEARLNDVIIYAIGLDVAGLSNARRNLDRLADETGGRAYFVKKADELKGVYTTIMEELRAHYQVVYASDNQKFDGRFMPVQISLKESKGYEVRHRAGYHAVEP